MTVASTHTKNLAVGWDISATAKADSGEKISRVQILVNGSSEYDQLFDPPIGNWQDVLTQQGQYPGSNVVQVIATSDSSDNTESYDAWN
jgi:hypothetical protein